jgi:hypothetical protein
MSPEAAADLASVHSPPGPLVSVLVRSLDRPELDEALRSIAAQTHAAVEVVVVAVDPHHRALPQHCGAFPLHLIPAEHVRPRSVAANVGLDAAHGELILFLDDDDWLMPGHVSRLVATLQAHPQAGAAYAGVAMVAADGKPLGQIFDVPFDAVRQLAGNLTPIHAVLFRSSLRERGCRFDESLDRYEDWDFWLQMAAHTPFVHLPGVSAVYRIHDSSGVHDEVGTNAAPSLRVYRKWQDAWSADQLADIMSRVWKTAELELQLNQAQQDLFETRHSRDELAQAMNRLNAEWVSFQQSQLVASVEVHRRLDEVQQSVRQGVQLLNETAAKAQATQARQADLIARQNEELVARRAEVSHWHRAFEAMAASTSWKLTAPLRGLAELLRSASRKR